MDLQLKITNTLAMEINQRRKDGRTPLRVVAMGIKLRCTNPTHPSYKNYGAKGVSFHPDWAQNYSAFEEYCLKNGWTDGCHVARKGDKGNYEPGNIEFISPKENIRAKKDTKMSPQRVKEVFSLYSQHMTHQEIADRMSVDQSTISRILSGETWGDVHHEIKSSSVNGKAQKLISKEVREILKDHHLNGVPKKVLARRFGMAPNNIRGILSGKYWNAIWREFNYLQMFLNPSPTADYKS